MTNQILAIPMGQNKKTAKKVLFPRVILKVVTKDLSPKAEKRYKKMIDDIKKGANIDHEGPLPQAI